MIVNIGLNDAKSGEFEEDEIWGDYDKAINFLQFEQLLIKSE